MTGGRAALVGVGGLVLAGVAGLWALAADGVERAVAARHDDALRRVVAGLEREFGAVVAREEARPFLEWRYLYVPLDNANPAVVRSSLAQGPTDPAVRGYFSLEPDGTFLSPERPRGNELELVQQNLWSPPPQDGRDLEALVRSLPLVAATAPAREPLRPSQLVGTRQYNVDTFASATNAFDPGDGAEREVTVEVRPFRGLRRGDDLVLVRDVVAAGAVYRQGLVLDVTRLADAAAAEVLAEEGLTGAVALDWSGGLAPGAHTLSHTFAAPLQEVAVSVGVGELPELVGRARLGVVTLGGAVVLLVLGGAWLAARTVRVELAYAQRRTDFVSAVTHELKTPLTAIRMYAEMLRDGMVPEERRAEYLGTLTSESDRLSRLVANVLTLGQLEKGTAAPTLVVGDAAAVVAEALEVVRPHATAAGFRLEVVADPGLPPVRLDRDGLVQVLVNLVDNAVKFTADGERRVVFTLRARGGGVALSVRDFGPGVPEDQLARVFEPFWRGERELVRRTRGTGIGLALVRGLAAGMGASVEARNAPGGGFEVTLSLAALTA